MPQLTANNYTMHYQIDDFTDPWSTSETVWIQHGFGRNLNFWYHWIPLLAGQYRVLRRDMRGHGGSADPGPDYVWSVDDLLGDMKGFLDALEIEAVHYIGESVGGILGIAFAAKWPERFKSLTLCASPTSIRPHIQKTFALGYEDWPTALGTLGSGGWAKALIEQGSGLTAGDSPHLRWVLDEWAKTPTHVLQGLCRLVPSVDVEPILSQVSVPTLVLAPANSPLTPLSEQLAIRDGIPGAQMAVIEGSGHEIYVDAAQDCVDALLRFIRSLG